MYTNSVDLLAKKISLLEARDIPCVQDASTVVTRDIRAEELVAIGGGEALSSWG